MVTHYTQWNTVSKINGSSIDGGCDGEIVTYGFCATQDTRYRKESFLTRGIIPVFNTTNPNLGI